MKIKSCMHDLFVIKSYYIQARLFHIYNFFKNYPIQYFMKKIVSVEENLHLLYLSLFKSKHV